MSSLPNGSTFRHAQAALPKSLFGGDRPSLDAISDFYWDVANIEAHLAEIRGYWAARMNVSVPQWMILISLETLDHGEGVAVKDVSAKMSVDSSFVTTQSKLLQAKGLVQRIPSRKDGRVMLMSLTREAAAQMAAFRERRQTVQKFVFADFDAHTLGGFFSLMGTVKDKFERLTRILAADIEPG